MNNEALFEGIKQEVSRNLQARHHRNGGLDIDALIKEAVYCLAVNVIISRRQLIQATGGSITDVPKETIAVLFKGMRYALKSLFPQNFQEELMESVKEDYDLLMANRNAEREINKHYNELYGADGGNVL